MGEIKGFTSPEALNVAPNDDVLIGDNKSAEITELSPYPANTVIRKQRGAGFLGGNVFVHSIAKSAANDFLYVGTEGTELPGGGSCNGNPFITFDNFGNVLEVTKPSCQSWVAVDNDPQSDSYGDYYLYANGQISKFDGYGKPVPFTGAASYINGNALTGTPFSGLTDSNFNPDMAGIAVDGEGHIWAVNQENKELDEFSQTGVFIQRITEKSSGAPGGESPGGPHAYGYYPGITEVAVDPTNGDILTSDKANGKIDEFSPQGIYVGSVDGSGTPAGKFKYACEEPYGPPPFCHTHVIGFGVDSHGYLYVADGLSGAVYIYGPRPAQPTIVAKPPTNPTATGGRINALVEPNGGGNITGCKFEYGTTINEYKSGTLPCSPDPGGGSFSGPTEVHVDLAALTSETTYHYRWTVENANAVRVGPDQTFTPHKVLGLRAEPADAISPSGATLHGSFVGNGASTTYWFEYGPTTAYGSKVPLSPPSGNAGSPAGPGLTSLEAAISGLKPVTRYHYRIVAENGSLSRSEDASFRTLPLRPQVKEYVTGVHSNQVLLNSDINPGGADTVYTFEYGTEKCSQEPDPCTTAFPDTHIGSNLEPNLASKELEGLQAETTYYYRVIATNSQGTTKGPDRTFSTFQFSNELKDSCPNALARQQTGAALVTDCRAYELVSSAHAGGYDVESDLVPGQKPFEGYPDADGPLRVLYGIHNGAIPGVAGNPTNHGVDPYVATRGSEGWTTSYVGIPANDPFATAPFASTLAGADAGLNVFAFGGPEICSPCFSGNSTGVPLHLGNGELTQGMAGSIEPPAPATSDGLVRKDFSADGSHFVFSTTTQLETGGNDSTGDVSIYDRDLNTGATQVVSTDGAGSPLSCLQGAGACHAPGDGDGISELDISEDGSRIVTGQKISTDADGNDYFHLYMHIGSDPHSADLTPGAVSGALYDGMTADGSTVFFTTKDHLLPADTDNSADIYEASVSGSGSVSLRLVTTASGEAVNDDSCTPPGEPNTWNAAAGDGKCSAVAFAGGAGVASDSNTIYFLSPELLGSAAEAEGEAGEPNVYVAREGSEPEFVATIDSSAVKPPPAPHAHTVGTTNFRNGLERPEALAVDQNSGDVYVAEAEAGQISRWTSAGKAHNFSATGSNKIGGIELGSGEGQVAVDSSNGPLKGDIYATTNYGNAIKVFSETGAELGEINVGSETCGVAVDPSNGDVYAGIYPSEIERFRPKSGAAAPIDNSDYEPVEGVEVSNEHCNVDAAADGHVYSWTYYGGPVTQIQSSSFTTAPFGSPAGVSFGEGVAVQSDPSNGDVYVNKGGKVIRYSSAGAQLEEFGSGVLSGTSRGIGVNGKTGQVYVSDGGSVKVFSYPPPYEPIDNPAVVHAVRDSGTHHWSDFQVTPDGRFAAFTTRLPLDEGFENLEHAEVYRYDASSQALDCVSCPPTNALATGDASLASNGLSLADDGRVFFNTQEGIVLRDGDETKDVYEWEKEGTGPKTGGCEPGNPNLFPTGICLSLISSGTSQFDSSLLSITSDGHDAFFFTHDTLAHGDENGPIAKIYDARIEGGQFDVPPPALCAASDECHGPGTKAAESPPIRTIAATPGNPGSGGKSKGCKKPKVMRHGKCVQKTKHHKRHHRRHHNRRAR